ncbi:hypothetical protein CHARACLAT_022275 [Characodon lateralis]|uniref:Uncharacterized protein n=1 Tax=Characodon lateralis TaxID=208331 RepID=A0ABU7CSE3_9TELE|nr:hypothetical protein [Characodon lateralis]
MIYRLYHTDEAHYDRPKEPTQLSCLSVSVQVQSAPVQNVTVEIVGIIKSGRMGSELEVLINNQVNTFIVASPLLAAVLGVRLADDLEDRLLEKIPFLVQAEIQGNKITDLKAAEEM